MYASLGNIVFQTLVSFDALSDTRETKYAQLELINGKPTLQRTGEALTEFTMGISFHIAFCNPEDEYLKLNNARVNSEVLEFIYGNGFNEGNYVITRIDRTIQQTDKIGNFVEITCQITLLEYIGGNAEAGQLEQDKKNAFALSENRPLPASVSVQTDNPALAVCNDNKTVQQAAGQSTAISNSLSDKIGLVTSGVIDKAQAFVNEVSGYADKINVQVSKTNTALGSTTVLINSYASITNESPTLPAKVSAVQSALTAVSSQLTLITGLPSVITTINDANTALTALTNTLNVIKTLKDNTQAMNDAAASIAKALATKRVMT